MNRRLAFNALVGNLDDHEKNHGVVADASRAAPGRAGIARH